MPNGDDKDIKFFLGQVSQNLKNNFNIMQEVKSHQEAQSRDIAEIKSEVKVNNINFTNQVDQCGKKFELFDQKTKDLEGRSSRDYSAINKLRETVGVDEKSTEKTKNWISWIVGIGMFILVSVSVYNTFDSKQKKIIVLDKKSIEQLKMELKNE